MTFRDGGKDRERNEFPVAGKPRDLQGRRDGVAAQLRALAAA
jgi:hypothetical protein